MNVVVPMPKHRFFLEQFLTLPPAAGIASHLYHCLNAISDGIEELNYFTLNFDDHHLHTGQELWRRAEECATTLKGQWKVPKHQVYSIPVWRVQNSYIWGATWQKTAHFAMLLANILIFPNNL